MSCVRRESVRSPSVGNLQPGVRNRPIACDDAGMGIDPLTAVRDIALSFPEATEAETWGTPTFRVRDKMFVTFSVDDDGRASVTMKAAPGEQDSLLAQGERFFLPRYVGTKGWIGVHVGEGTDWAEIAELIIDSYREIAPLSLSRDVGIRPGPRSPGARAVLAVGSVIAEYVEGKPPKDEVVAEQQADDDLDNGELDLTFDPDDPSGTSLEL